MKKFNFKRLICLLSVLTLSISLLCFGGCKTTETVNKTNEFKNFELVFDNFNDFGITLEKTSSTLVEGENGNYLVQRISASVIGDPNNLTSLDWAISWVDNPDLEVSTEYLELKPSGAGNRYCDVICYKNFEEFGNAVVTVTSIENPSLKASCMVEYLGAPISFDLSGSYESVRVVGEDFTLFEEEKYYEYYLVLDNHLGVGSAYGENYTVDFEILEFYAIYDCELWGTDGLLGTAKNQLYDCMSIDSISTVTINDTDFTVGLSEFSNIEKYFTYEIDTFTNTFGIKPNNMQDKLFNGLNGEANYGGAPCPQYGVKAILKDYWIFVSLTITEVESGLSDKFNFCVNPYLHEEY